MALIATARMTNTDLQMDYFWQQATKLLSNSALEIVRQTMLRKVAMPTRTITQRSLRPYAPMEQALKPCVNLPSVLNILTDRRDVIGLAVSAEILASFDDISM